MNLPFDLTPDTFYFIWFLLMFTIVGLLLISGWKALKIFPPSDQLNILFHEKWASGNSNDTLIHKMGGASKVLDIIITENELWIKPIPLMAGFSNIYGLIRKIKLNNISKVQLKNRIIIIQFANENGSKSEFQLKLKNPQQFLEVISDKTPESTVIQK